MSPLLRAGVSWQESTGLRMNFITTRWNRKSFQQQKWKTPKRDLTDKVTRMKKRGSWDEKLVRKKARCSQTTMLTLWRDAMQFVFWILRKERPVLGHSAVSMTLSLHFLAAVYISSSSHCLHQPQVVWETFKSSQFSIRAFQLSLCHLAPEHTAATWRSDSLSHYHSLTFPGCMRTLKIVFCSFVWSLRNDSCFKSTAWADWMILNTDLTVISFLTTVIIWPQRES